LLVAFAAETHDALRHGRDKLLRKRADLIVVNEVGPERGFGADVNAATVLGADGTVTDLPEQPKEGLADAVWDLVVQRFPQSRTNLNSHSADTRTDTQRHTN
jgi:phosphopantothenoylcysteine decarboxylase/phosphopantothenate--cysteine ligase